MLALAGLFRALLASAPPPSSSSHPLARATDGQYTIRMAVERVVLHATVEKRNGVHVSGLTQENFQVYEGRVLQQIKSFIHEDIPVTVGLVVDNSGSMRPKLADVTAAALAFARSSNPDDEMFVVNFNEKVSFGLPADTPFTDQVPQLELALSRINADGRTALYDAVAAALDHLKKAHRDKKVLIVITDGGDNASAQTLDAVTVMAIKSDAIVYAIGLFDEVDPDRNPRALKRLATATGGEAFLPESLQEVMPVCEHIAHDIRTQYAITYLPANQKQDGSYRTIQVKAKAPGYGRLAVRTRPGYYAPNAPPAPPTGANGANTNGNEERR
jgi:Ca-activated chloride channel homolog